MESSELLQIEEPVNTEVASDHPVIGIDFGTTNSVVAISIAGQATIIPNVIGSQLTPSVVAINRSGALVTESRHSYPNTTTVHSIKRLLGKTADEIESAQALIPIYHKIKALEDEAAAISQPIEVAAVILRALKEQAEQYLQRPVQHAIITVPAYFGERQRRAIKQAALLTGLRTLRLIAEPTAAAYAYGASLQGLYIVYDLGGGTFDISLINIDQNLVQVLAVGGDIALGGDDLDRLLLKYIEQKYELSYTDTSVAMLLTRTLKEQLSKCDVAETLIGGLPVKLTRAEFEDIIYPTIAYSVSLVQKLLKDAQINAKGLDGCILVGGSSKISLIANQLQQVLKVKIINYLDPELVVAMGAALQGQNLKDKCKYLLLDVVPLSLGIEVMGGIAEKLILRNSPLPVEVTRNFTTQVDWQTGIVLHVVQGEREMIKDLQSIARFELLGIVPQRAGIAQISVTFSVDVDGLLSVKAVDSTSGITSEISVQVHDRIEDEDILAEVQQAAIHAQEDYQVYITQNTLNEARLLVNNAKALLNALQGQYEQKILNQVTHLAAELERAITQGYPDVDPILQTLRLQLSPLAEFYANQKLRFLRNRHIDSLS